MRFLALAVMSSLAMGCAAAAPRPAVEGVRRLAVNGAEIAYVVDGTGPPVLIIHGAWGDFRSFSGAVPILAKGRTVIRVSLRHHWPNSPPASEPEALASYRVEVHAADVAGLIEKMGRGPADLVGHSYGGVVAALVAQSRPDLVRRLVLVEPALYGILWSTPLGQKYIADESRWRDGKLARVRDGMDGVTIGRIIYDDTRPGTFEAFPQPRRGIFEDNASMVRLILINNWVDVPYTCAEARHLGMPVLLVEGEKTDPDMREIDTQLLGCLPDARRVVLPNASHAIQFDAPEAMASAVVEFLAR